MLDKKTFSCEVVFTDTDRLKRRISFYGAGHYNYSKDNIARTPTAVRVPCSMVLEGVWLNLQFDIQSFIDRCF